MRNSLLNHQESICFHVVPNNGIIYTTLHHLNRNVENLEIGILDRTSEFGYLPKSLISQTPYLITDKSIIATPTYKKI